MPREPFILLQCSIIWPNIVIDDLSFSRFIPKSRYPRYGMILVCLGYILSVWIDIMANKWNRAQWRKMIKALCAASTHLVQLISHSCFRSTNLWSSLVISSICMDKEIYTHTKSQQCTVLSYYNINLRCKVLSWLNHRTLSFHPNTFHLLAYPTISGPHKYVHLILQFDFKPSIICIVLCDNRCIILGRTHLYHNIIVVINHE